MIGKLFALAALRDHTGKRVQVGKQHFCKEHGLRGFISRDFSAVRPVVADVSDFVSPILEGRRKNLPRGQVFNATVQSTAITARRLHSELYATSCHHCGRFIIRVVSHAKIFHGCFIRAGNVVRSVTRGFGRLRFRKDVQQIFKSQFIFFDITRFICHDFCANSAAAMTAGKKAKRKLWIMGFSHSVAKIKGNVRFTAVGTQGECDYETF